MKKKIIPLKFKWVLIIVITCFAMGCESNDDNTMSNDVVLLSSSNLSIDNTMALNSTANFNATIDGIDESQNLAYLWYLETFRGTLLINGQIVENAIQTLDSSIQVRGDNPGLETIKVEVVNTDSGEVLAEDSLSFEIVEPIDVARCFNEPVLFLRDGNWTRVFVFGTESGETNVINSTTVSAFTDMSPNGSLYLRQNLDDFTNIEIYLESCDPSVGSTLLVNGGQTELPTFGPEGVYVYYSKTIDYPEQIEDPRAKEIVRYDLQTGQEDFITDTRVFSGAPKVSPDGNWIAFEQAEPQFNTNGTFIGSITHLAIMPSEGGPAQLLFEIDWDNFRLGGYDWSPDSDNIIFYIDAYTNNSSSFTEGIYRVQRAGGSPFLIFTDGADTSSSAHNLGYYDNGNRIAIERGGDIWSIDANGNDLQLLFDDGFVNLDFIWEPIN
ncbi:TolB family protein [Psychroserpens sp.]|uniref:TolB family protein n=1 Tax=Psychroserpens sp. TaxID=2020870 RepID=UPI00385C8EBE